MDLKTLTAKHPEWTAQSEHWELLEAMSAGGHEVGERVRTKLLVNPDGRSSDVAKERQKTSIYQNFIAPMITRLISELFYKDVAFEGSDDPYWTDIFFQTGSVISCDDDGRTTFQNLLREMMFDALTVGKAIARVDTRIVEADPISIADQEMLDPYVSLVDRENLWDWEADKDGFIFAKLHQMSLEKKRWDAPRIPKHDFTLYQKEEDGTILVSRYIVELTEEAQKKNGSETFDLGALKDDDVIISPFLTKNGLPLIDRKLFNFRGKYKFPIVTLKMPDSLWVADQLFDAQKSQFNIQSGCQWSLTRANFSMISVTQPADYAESTEVAPTQKSILGDKKFGDGFFLELPFGTQTNVLQISSSAVPTSMQYLDQVVRRNIAETLQQIVLSAGDSATVAARSGASKTEDRRPETQLMKRFGDMVKLFAKQILDVASIARGSEIEWKVLGLDQFKVEGLIEYFQDFVGIRQTEIPSLTLLEEAHKNLANKYAELYGLPPDKLQIIIQEITDRFEAARTDNIDLPFLTPIPSLAPPTLPL